MSNTFRKALGRIKCKVVDELPYRNAQRAIPKNRSRLRKYLKELNPVGPPRDVIYEIHMLCGHRDCDMGIWASWSLMRFLGEKARLIVHCDGSLTEKDVVEWDRVVRGIEVVSRLTADVEVGRRLGHTRHLYRWRCSYRTSPQLVDSHLFGSAPILLLMDSDVLVFSYPKELIGALSEGGFTWCNDVRDAYSATPALIEQVTGVRVPPRFNSGMLVAPRFSQDHFMRLDHFMERIQRSGEMDLNRYWACQTYYAMMSTFWNHAKGLSACYETTMGRTGGDMVVRHYVGIPKVRYRFYTEGVARLLDQIDIPTP